MWHPSWKCGCCLGKYRGSLRVIVVIVMRIVEAAQIVGLLKCCGGGDAQE